MGQEPDNDVLQQAINGDWDAFETLIRHYEKLIYNIAYRMFNNVEDAKDISQEALIKVYKNIGKCNDIKSFKNWVCTITTNTCIDQLRKRKIRIQPYSLDAEVQQEDGEMQTQVKSDMPTPEEALLKRERNKQILKAVNSLPAKDKSIIILRDIQGLSYADIGDIMGVNIGTVKSKIARARKKLQILIQVELP